MFNQAPARVHATASGKVIGKTEGRAPPYDKSRSGDSSNKLAPLVSMTFLYQ